MAATPQEVSRLLAAWGDGDREALDELIPLVYGELRRLAHLYTGGESPGNTLQTSALVNEAYLRLADQTNPRWQNRAHFFAICARLMRQILVDHARRRRSLKRGGSEKHVTLNEPMIVSEERAAKVVALDEALKSLAELDYRQCRIVELRFFGGLSIKEAAEVLDVSPGTVMRDWTIAKAWLRREISGGE
ncbi:MAG TPA: sigma-70 family RNA polymerase sigma factor [Blastocatellia bacterium]|nr:sigma-70 family RNA polymerase sigma factor [Blastocatellia bacterium]